MAAIALGELCLLAFMNRHSRNLGQLLIVAMSWLRLPDAGARRGDPGLAQRRQGALDFTTLDYEALLPRPLDDVRRELGIVEPTLLSGDHVVKGLWYAGRELALDFASTLFFLVLYELTRSLALSVGVAIAVAFAQIGWKLARGQQDRRPAMGQPGAGGQLGLGHADHQQSRLRDAEAHRDLYRGRLGHAAAGLDDALHAAARDGIGARPGDRLRLCLGRR